MHTTLRILGWTIAVACYALGVWVAAAMFFFLLSPPGWVFIPGVLIVIKGIRSRLAKRRVSAVLTYLEQAVRLNLPLPEMLASAAASETGRLADTLHKLTDQLREGRSVSESLDRSLRDASPRLRSLISVGERLGRLPQALARVTTKRRTSDRYDTPSSAMIWGYPVALLSILILVLGFCLLMIIPKYILIFEDFDVELPAITVSLIEFANWFGGPLLGAMGAYTYNEDQLIPGFFWLIVLAAIGWALVVLIRTGSLAWVWDPLVWSLPVVGKTARSRSMGDVCHVVEQALAAGLPLDAALIEASHCRINTVLRRRVRRWAALIREGRSLHDAARQARMPAIVVGMLAPAQAGNCVPEAFGFLRRHYDITFSRLAALLRGAAVPMMVLACAAVVAWFVLAMFVPLVHLIWSVAPDPNPGPLL